MNKLKLSNLDSNETAFFLRELEYVKEKTFDTKYRQLKAASLIPVNTEAGAGVESITYRRYTAFGMARIISDYADDIPLVDIYGVEESVKVYHIVAGYKYSFFEIKKAQKAGLALESKKAEITNKVIDQTTDKIAWFGDADHNIPGFINYPGIQHYVTPNGAGGTPQWSTKTATEILKDLNGIISTVVNVTNGVEDPNQIILPIAQYRLIANTQISTGSDYTILEYFKRNNPNVSVDWVAELKGSGVGTSDRMMAYVKDPDHLTQEIPVLREQYEPQPEGLAYKIPVTSDVAGVIVYYPLSVAYADNI